MVKYIKIEHYFFLAIAVVALAGFLSLDFDNFLTGAVVGEVNGIVDIYIVPEGSHNNGIQCPSGFVYVGAVTDCGGNKCLGYQKICVKYGTSGPFVDFISMTPEGTHRVGGSSCPPGSAKIGSFTDCGGGRCYGNQNVCIRKSSSGNALTNLFISPPNFHVAGGVNSVICSGTRGATIGSVADCGNGKCSGNQKICAKTEKITIPTTVFSASNKAISPTITKPVSAPVQMRTEEFILYNPLQFLYDVNKPGIPLNILEIPENTLFYAKFELRNPFPYGSSITVSGFIDNKRLDKPASTPVGLLPGKKMSGWLSFPALKSGKHIIKMQYESTTPLEIPINVIQVQQFVSARSYDKYR